MNEMRQLNQQFTVFENGNLSIDNGLSHIYKKYQSFQYNFASLPAHSSLLQITHVLYMSTFLFLFLTIMLYRDKMVRF